ncbi:hypothetical protein PTTG_04841 [Puccinia triticina 1-1 BBBD Race 1]|uniref:ATPase_2 domain-containing protein n=1 Tax=Puccinia triticina (isolate 1-1 / race 1 (BBBD)) TaxID=630390 RepID=A0A180GT66_PUCT1|nr:hypothetical protein PTTG_04841 [Puccinia triticina 1-1 BBBD Race 1]
MARVALTIQDSFSLSRSFPSGGSARAFHSQDLPRHPFPFYYSRPQEEKELFRRLKGKPHLTVLQGPSACGKIALSRHVTTQLRSDGTPEFHPLTIGLLAVHKDRFLDAFTDGMSGSAAEENVWKYVYNRLKIRSNNSSLEAVGIESYKQTAAAVFKQVENHLKPSSFSYEERTPVLIITEADKLKGMGDEAIRAFLDFAVRVTEEEAKMHIIFTSSDSLFVSWLKQRINPAHFSTLVVGDLSRQQAHDYFLQVVKNDRQLSEEDKTLLSSVKFDIPFRITGGRMYIINRYVSEVNSSGYFDDPMRFGVTSNAYSRMTGEFVGGAKKTYGGAEALTVGQLLINSPGYIPYSTLVEKLGREVVEEMLERNLLDLRSNSDFSSDLVPSPTEPVLTPTSEPNLRAMEKLVKQFQEY